MSTDTIRDGIIGAGRNTTSRHIHGLQAIENVEIVSVCNRSRASSERVAKEFNIPTIYEGWEDLVDASDTNAIVIGTWPYMHYPVTMAAILAVSTVAIAVASGVLPGRMAAAAGSQAGSRMD